jgi:hypothetical protein
LAVLFIGTIFLVSGLILALGYTDPKGRKVGMFLILAGLLVYFACWLFTPRNDNFRIFNDNPYQL